MIKASAPGKIHLSGEHSVVYAKPALLAAINKRIFISIKKRTDEKAYIKNKNLNKKSVTTFSEIRKFSYLNQLAWKSDDEFALVKAGIDEIYGFLQQKPKTGFNLLINSDIPVGFGLGSSAGLAMALTACVLGFEGYDFNKNLINKIAFNIEKRQHGTPSGGDNTICCYGGFLEFKKTNKGYNYNQIKVSKNKMPKFLLVNSGKPVEPTGEMVFAVKQQITNYKLQITKILAKLGNLTNEFIDNLTKLGTNQLENLITRNERLLEELGVVGNKAKKIIRLIEKNGGAGKICGAGGIKEGSGMILVYHKDLNKLKKVLKKRHIEYMDTSLGQKGVVIEK